MGHPQDDFADAELRRPFDDRVEQGDEHLSPSREKRLLSDVVAVEERLEELGGVELENDPPLFAEVEVGSVAVRFHPRLKPATDFDVADVHVLHADFTAVRLAQDRDQLAERRVGRVAESVVKALIEIGRAEAERGKIQQFVRVAWRVELQRVEVGQVMADLAVGVDQAGDGGLSPRGIQIDVGLAIPSPDWPASYPSKKSRHDSSTEAGSVRQLLVVTLDKIEIPPVRDRRAIHWKRSLVGSGAWPNPLPNWQSRTMVGLAEKRDDTHDLSITQRFP